MAIRQSLEDLADHALIHYASTLGFRPPGFEVMIDGVGARLKPAAY
ncbi:hypothetical protein LAD77_00120 [Klebsiella pneumoniae]|nr:hypothetical protein [Klebsiella pneumoniae]